MEVEINKEILNIREGVFFGLPLRELLSVIVAVLFSICAYVLFGNVMICAAVSVLPIVIGFVTYHGMNGGRAMLAMIQDITGPKRLTASKSDMALACFCQELTEAERKGRKNEHRKKDT